MIRPLLFPAVGEQGNEFWCQVFQMQFTNEIIIIFPFVPNTHLKSNTNLKYFTGGCL